MVTKRSRTTINVSPSEDGWRVKRVGAQRADSVHRRKTEAVERARQIGHKARTHTRREASRRRPRAGR